MSYLSKKEYKIVPVKSFEIIHACAGCGKKQSFINTKRFRVNANGNRLDVWLIYQCKKCKHTLNIPIFERIDKNKIEKDKYELFLENDEILAEKYGMNLNFLRTSHFEANIKSVELELHDIDGNIIATSKNEFNSDELIVVQNKCGIKLRAEKVASMVFGISVSSAKKMILKEELIVTQNNQSFEISYKL